MPGKLRQRLPLALTFGALATAYMALAVALAFILAQWLQPQSRMTTASQEITIAVAGTR